MSTKFQVPTNFRQSLFYEQFLEAKKLNPEYPFAFTLERDVPNAQIQSITYKRFISDVSRVARALQSSVPARQAGTIPRNVGILARSSYTYAVHWIACSMNRWTPTLISTKNSREAIQHLLKVSNSTHLLVDKNFRSFAQSLELDIPLVDFEDITKFLNDSEDDEESFQLEQLTEDQRTKEMEFPAFYLHTSGSTGHPKIIGISHKVLGAWQDTNSREIPLFERSVILIQSPLYHAFGCFMVLAISTSCGAINFITDSVRPHTSESLVKEARMLDGYLKANSLERFGVLNGFLTLTVPSILIDLAANGIDEIKEFSKLSRGVMFGGAPLPVETGDLLAEHGINLYSGFGMTEIGLLSKFAFSPEPRTNGEWRYIHLRNGYKYQWIPTDESLRNKLVILPDVDSTAVFNQTDPLGFDTNDIWAEHPTKKGWYRHDGRAGDVTVLANGEKTDNKQLHSILITHDNRIAHAIVFGSGRSQNGLLISPHHPQSSNNGSKFIDEIWPTIEYMNNIVPAHSRVVKELVLIEDPDIPFRLTDKGTVREKVTLNLYKALIDKAYGNLESQQQDEVAFPTTYGKEEIEVFLREVIRTLLPEGGFGMDADLFEYGMDSLLAVRLRSYIAQLIKKAQPALAINIPKNIVYDRPTIAALVDYILSNVSSNSQTQGGSDDVVTRVRQAVERHSAGFSSRIINAKTVNDEDGMEYVIVTGTTGSLGSFLVDQLLDRPTVKKIYCFNRKSDTETTKRQLSGFKDRGLNPAKLEKVLGDRVVMHDVDLSQPRLGLSDDVYEEIRTLVTHIIHNAWQLNFKLRMEGFERTHIAGTRHLIDLALSSTRPRSPRFVFMSSISAVTNYKGPGGVPEEPVFDEHLAVMGYGHSKLVGERITENAVKKAGLNAAIVRIGQISGSSTAGAWQTSEYNPILFRSCFGLGTVPSDLPPVRWIPSDVTASVALKQTFAKSGNDGSLDYFHLENPTSTPWSEVANVIANYKGANLALVPLQKWLSKAREHSIDDADKVPAVRLLEFFENLEVSPALDVKNTLAVAPELDFGKVTSDLLNRYLDYQRIL